MEKTGKDYKCLVFGPFSYNYDKEYSKRLFLIAIAPLLFTDTMRMRRGDRTRRFYQLSEYVCG